MNKKPDQVPSIIDELNELFKDKLGAVFQRDISEIKMELKEKGLSTKPPKEFTDFFPEHEEQGIDPK